MIMEVLANLGLLFVPTGLRIIAQGSALGIARNEFAGEGGVLSFSHVTEAGFQPSHLRAATEYGW